MTFPFWKSKAAPVRGRISCGLDIGSSGVKAVVLREGGKREVLGVARVPLPAHASREKRILALQSACQAAGFVGRRVTVALGGQSVIIRYVQLPKMTKEELKSSIEFEADKYIPFNVKEVSLDCQILEERSDAKKIQALLVAAKKDLVHSQATLVQEAGLECAVLDVDTFAVVNAFETVSSRLTKKEVVVLLDMGAETTNINILRGSQTLFSRNIPIGGSRLTEAIAEKLNLALAQAEALKLRPGDRSKEVLEAVDPILENLIGELRLSFDYFESQYDKRVEHLFLSGGSSRWEGLFALLKEHFQTEVTTWNPFEGLPLADPAAGKLKEGREDFAVAFGLALRAPDDQA